MYLSLTTPVKALLHVFSYKKFLGGTIHSDHAKKQIYGQDVDGSSGSHTLELLLLKCIFNYRNVSF